MKTPCALLATWLAFSANAQTTTAINSIPSAGTATETNLSRLKPSSPGTNVMIKLLVSQAADKSQTNATKQEVSAKIVTYDLAVKAQSFEQNQMKKEVDFIEIHDPYTKKCCINEALMNFYTSSHSGMTGYWLVPGVLLYAPSLIEVADAEGGMPVAIARFEVEYYGKEVHDLHKDRIGLRQAVTEGYFESGSASIFPKLEAVDLTDDTLRLDIRNPITQKPAVLWINLKTKKVVKSIVDGEEMDLTRPDKPWTEPLKKK